MLASHQYTFLLKQTSEKTLGEEWRYQPEGNGDEVPELRIMESRRREILWLLWKGCCPSSPAVNRGIPANGKKDWHEQNVSHGGHSRSDIIDCGCCHIDHGVLGERPTLEDNQVDSHECRDVRYLRCGSVKHGRGKWICYDTLHRVL